VFSTVVGGSQDDSGTGIAGDATGSGYLVGTTRSSDFPVSNAFQAGYGGNWDMYLMKLAPDSTAASSIVALPSSIHFTMVTGGFTPTPQVINLDTASGGMPGTFNAAATTSSGANWLSVTPASGNTPGQLAVSVNPAGLGLGVYNGTVQIAPASGASVTIPVVFRMIPVTPVLTSATPAKFDVANFDVLDPSAALPAVTLTISGTGFVSGATAWVTTFAPGNTQPYATSLVDSNTLQLSLPQAAQPTSVTIQVSNPGTPKSNPLNLVEGNPFIGAAHVFDLTSGGVANGPVAPGDVVNIVGINVGPLVPFSAPRDGTAVTNLGGAQILFDGVSAKLVSAYFMTTQAIVPASVAGKSQTKVVVKYFDRSSAPIAVPVAGGAPAPPTSDPFGPGLSAVVNSDGSVNSATNPATVGSVVMLVVDFSQVPGTAPPVSVTIGGVAATMVPMDDVIGHPGKLQFSVRVPTGAPSGPTVPVVVQFLNSQAVANLTMAIQ
ncbi:MAG TPA: hypothetical protein VGZ73_12285, partial [Bryobacteraceae bacterium]|nr:hypothetical protein [Bryobacteraceae bacterium]